MISQQKLNQLSADERERVIRALVKLSQDQPQLTRRATWLRGWFLRLLAVACAALVPWSVVLAVTLPRHYVAARWGLTWAVFDAGLLVALAATVWTLWRRRQAFVICALVTATLLICDAWFDVMTAHTHGDLYVSLAFAGFAELPTAVILVSLVRRMLHATLRAARGTPPGEATPSFWRLPLALPHDTPS
jgi:hypothetical protein